MNEENKKNEGPRCACGKTDLYEEWLKNENKKKEASGTANSKEVEEGKSTADSSEKE